MLQSEIKEEQALKICSGDLAELLKIRLLCSLKIPQNEVVAAKSQLPQFLFLKEQTLQDVQKTFMDEESCGRKRFRDYVTRSQTRKLKGNLRKR